MTRPSRAPSVWSICSGRRPLGKGAAAGRPGSSVGVRRRSLWCRRRRVVLRRAGLSGAAPVPGPVRMPLQRGPLTAVVSPTAWPPIPRRYCAGRGCAARSSAARRCRIKRRGRSSSKRSPRLRRSVSGWLCPPRWSLRPTSPTWRKALRSALSLRWGSRLRWRGRSVTAPQCERNTSSSRASAQAVWWWSGMHWCPPAWRAPQPLLLSS